MKNTKTKFTSKQLKVLIGACLFQCAMLGILINCTGVLFAQIRNEFAFSMSKVSVYNTIKSVTTALAATAVTSYYFKSKKSRTLFINQIIIIVSFLVLNVGAQGPLFYVSAVLCGLGCCFSSTAVPVVLNQWFPGNAGTATGIAMAFSGIGGAICNPLCARMIGMFGWKWAIVALSVITMVLTIPGLLLMFHEEAPNPAVNTRAKVKGTGEKRDLKWGNIILVTVVLTASSLGMSIVLNASTLFQELGYSLEIGAAMTTMIMIGNVCTKFLYGMMCDKLGTWRATQIGLGAVAAAALCILLIPGQLAMLYVASLLLGSVYALSVVGLSRCVIGAYGDESKRYLGIHASIQGGVTAVVSLLIGVLVDKFGGYNPVLILLTVLVACSIVAAQILHMKTAKK